MLQAPTPLCSPFSLVATRAFRRGCRCRVERRSHRNPARSRSHTGRENWRALGRCLVLQRPPGHHLLVHGPLLRSQDGNSRSRLDRWRWLGVAILYAWTEADQALWAEVLNFWFLGRVFYRVRPSLRPQASADHGGRSRGLSGRDLQTALTATLRYCPVLASEPEARLAAIVDFTFNLGAGRLQTSTLRR